MVGSAQLSSARQVKCPCAGRRGQQQEQQPEQRQPEHSWWDQRKKSIVQVKVKLFKELLPDVLAGCPGDLLSFHAFIALTAFRPQPHPTPLSYAVYSAAKRASWFALWPPHQIAIDTLSLQL